ncbi:MAG: cytochrome P450 [Elainellaceae cyanobacterium]
MIAIAPDSIAHIPGPQPFPVIGKTLNAWRYGRDSITYASHLFSTYGNVVSLAAGGGTNFYSPLPNCPGTVIAYGADVVREVTTQHEVFYKQPISGTLYRLKDQSPRSEPLKHFGVGLFGINSQQHLQTRKLMMPAFHHKQIATYRDDMVAIAQSMVDRIPCDEPFDFSATMRLLTMRIATKTLFGDDIHEAGGSVGKLIQDILNLLGNAVLLPVDLPGLPYHRMLTLMQQLDDQMRTLIERKRQSHTETPDVLSMLLSAQDAETGLTLSEDELLGHAGVIFTAGHETSSNALTWTIFLLSQHPDIAADLHDELGHVLQGAAPTVDQLQQLPLLNKVVKESLRIIPPAPWNGRVTSQPTELTGRPLPSGTEVIVSIYHTHHHADLFPDPDAFDPHRWDDINPSPYEYNPFSAGPRTCIGAAFALMEIKLILAMLLQRYRFQPVGDRPVDRSGFIVITPKGGLPLVAHLQDRNFRQGVGGIRGNVRDMVNLPD